MGRAHRAGRRRPAGGAGGAAPCPERCAVRRGAHGRADAGDERPRGHARVAPRLQRRAAADHCPDRGCAGQRARPGTGRRHERLPDQAHRCPAPAPGAAALGGFAARQPAASAS
ncbi:hypothetical protein LDC_0097 [sediment metagenome]|uniref:Uncharacterized protein n=1 Tax=sediment metagenome TaxID=749907 RepID=D9PF19_9ZZZZ